MTTLLFDINLLTVTDEALAGPWRVVSRVLNRADPEQVLAQVEALDLQVATRLVVQAPASAPAPTTLAGRWLVQRDTLLNRPYLILELPFLETRALVTRLRRSGDGLVRHLILYFQSGMELELTSP